MDGNSLVPKDSEPKHNLSTRPRAIPRRPLLPEPRPSIFSGDDHVCRPQAGPGPARRDQRRRLRGAEPDPGAGDPAAARRAGRDRPGADRLGQDGGVRAADAAVRRSRPSSEVQAPRTDADPRAVHPGHPGAAHLRASARASTSSRCSAAPRSAARGPAARGRPHRGRHRRAGQGPDLAPLAAAQRVSLRGARRGRRDARPRLPGGRRADPVADPVQPADRAVLGDDAARDPPAGRAVPV